MKITRTMTPRGIRSDLFFRYRGVRYRPVLGYNLTSDQEQEATLQIVAAVQSRVGGAPGATALMRSQWYQLVA